jgi:hypothetical protein
LQLLTMGSNVLSSVGNPADVLEDTMTTLEAIVSISQTALRANGRWTTDGMTDCLRRDIRGTVHDVSHLFPRIEDVDILLPRAIAELERRATPLD